MAFDSSRQCSHCEQGSSSSDSLSGLSCSNCGGNMPLNIPSGGISEPHEWRIRLFQQYMYMPGLQKGTEELSTAEGLRRYMMVPTQMHMTMGGMTVGYSFHKDFFLMAMVMWMWKKMKMLNRAGRWSTMESIGIGDLMLMGKYRLYRGDSLSSQRQLSFLLGVQCPTGSIRKKDNGQILPYAMQMGSGTFDPILGILYTDSYSDFWWGVNLTYTKRFYNNPHGYHLGDQFRYDLYWMYQFCDTAVFELQVNGIWQGGLSGEMDEIQQGVGHVLSDPNRPYMSPLYDARQYGRHTLWLTVGIQWQPFPLHILNLQFAYPLYQNLKGLTMRQGFCIFFVWHVEIPTEKSRRADQTPFPF